MDHSKARDSNAVEKYMLGELSPEESEQFELHFFDCAECADEIRIATLFEANAREVFAEGYAPRTRWQSLMETWAEAWRRPAFAAPAFAALLLMGLAGYQNAVQIPALRVQATLAESPQLTAIATLRGVARGAESVTADPRPSRIRCEVQDSSGKVIESSVVAVPANGTVPLSVGTKRVGPGSWLLVVRDATSGAEISRYPFRYRIQ
jgi:hypothetical protein